MAECDLCGYSDGYVAGSPFGEIDILGLTRDGHDDDLWRIALVCETCQREALMPALRHLFEDGGHNLNPADGDPWVEVDPGEAGALFFAFTTPAGTKHAARSVRRHISSPDEYRCVGFCGIEADSAPEPRSRPLPNRGEGAVCSRCAVSEPRYFGGR